MGGAVTVALDIDTNPHHAINCDWGRALLLTEIQKNEYT